MEQTCYLLFNIILYTEALLYEAWSDYVDIEKKKYFGKQSMFTTQL